MPEPKVRRDGPPRRTKERGDDYMDDDRGEPDDRDRERDTPRDRDSGRDNPSGEGARDSGGRDSDGRDGGGRDDGAAFRGSSCPGVRGIRRDYYAEPVEDALILWREPLDGPPRDEDAA